MYSWEHLSAGPRLAQLGIKNLTAKEAVSLDLNARNSDDSLFSNLLAQIIVIRSLSSHPVFYFADQT